MTATRRRRSAVWVRAHEISFSVRPVQRPAARVAGVADGARRTTEDATWYRDWLRDNYPAPGFDGN